MDDYGSKYATGLKKQSRAAMLKQLGVTPTEDMPQKDPTPPQLPEPEAPAQDVEASQTEEGGMMDAVGNFFKELPMAVVGGVGDAVNNTVGAARDLGKLVGIPDMGALQLTDKEGNFKPTFLSQEELEAAGGISHALPEVDAQENTGAGMVRAITTFAAGFIPAAKGLKAVGMAGAAARGLVGGAVADAVVMDPHQARLATMLNEVPVLKAIVPDYMADNNPENESAWEGRMKNAIEGMGIGLAAEGVLKLVKAYKVSSVAAKAAKATEGTPDEAVKAMGEAMDAKAAAVDELVQPLNETGIKAVDDALGETETEWLERIIAEDDYVGGTGFEEFDAALNKPSSNTADKALELDYIKKIGDAEIDADLAMAKFAETGDKADGLLAKQANDAVKDIRAGKGVIKETENEWVDRITEEGDYVGGTGFEEVDAALNNGERGPVKTPKPKVFINMNRIKSSEDVKTMMQKIADDNASVLNAGGKTHAGIKKASKSEMKKVEELLGRKPAVPFTAEEAVAAREIMNASAENLSELAKSATGPTVTKEGQFAFRQALAKHQDIQSIVLQGRKATAQALNSWKIPTGSPEFRGKAISEMLEGGGKNIDDMARKIMDISENGGNVSDAAGKMVSGQWGDSLYQVWINGLLSGPATHAANFVSNAGTTMMGIGEKYISAGMESMVTKNGHAFVEANARVAGFSSGLMDGIRMVSGQMDDSMFIAGTKLEREASGLSSIAWGKAPDSFVGKGLDYIGKIVDLPGAALQKGDIFFKSINYRMMLNESAVKEAFEEGLTGQAFKARVKELVLNPTEAMTEVSHDFARYQTFTNEAGSTTKAIQKVFNGTPGGKYVMPFVRTPANILKYGFERTPLAPLLGEVRGELAKGGAAAATATAKMAAGSSIMMAAGTLTVNGNLTGAGPTNYKERRLLEQTGWQPYSVKCGDTYISYSRLEPVGSLLGYAADMAEIGGMVGEEEGDELAVAGIAAFFKSLGQKTFVSGAMKALDVINSGDPNKVSKYMQTMGSSFVPFSGLGRTLTKYTDDVKKDYTPDDNMGFLKSTLDRAKQSVPGWGSDQPPIRDIWGEEMHTSSGVAPVFNNMSPIAISKANDDKVSQMIADNKIVVDRPSRTVRGVRLTNKEYSRFTEIAGKKAKGILDKAMKANRFARLTGGPDGTKGLAIKTILRQSRKFAQAQIFKEMPEVKDRIIQNKLDKQAALKGE